jgi:hypothetical protein
MTRANGIARAAGRRGGWLFCQQAAAAVVAAAFIGCGGDDDGEAEGLPAAQAGLDGNPSSPVIGPELLTNGDFAEGLAPWTSYVENPANADYAAEAGEATIDIHAVAVDTGGIQLNYMSGLSLQAGETYRLSFRARATPERTISTSIWENGNDLDGNGFEWSTHQWNDHFLSPVMTAFMVEWVMPVTNTDAGLCFFMGDPDSSVLLEDGRVVIDDVSLVALD